MTQPAANLSPSLAPFSEPRSIRPLIFLLATTMQASTAIADGPVPIPDATPNVVAAAPESCPTYRPILTLAPEFSLRLERTNPWSPTEATLLVYGPDGLYVVDMDDTSRPPRQLVSASRVNAFSWAPDGRHVAILTGGLGRKAERKLLVASTAGDSVSVVAARESIWPIEWTRQGRLLYWTPGASSPMRVPLPSSMSKRPAGEVPGQHDLIPIIDPVTHVSTLALAEPSNSTNASTDRILDSLTANRTVLLKDAHPIGWTVMQSGRTLIVLDPKGALFKVLAVPDDHGWFLASSFVAGGNAIVGSFEESDGHAIIASSLGYVNLTEDSYCRLTTAGAGSNCKAARTGPYIAFTNHSTAAVEIGVLEHLP